MVSKRLPRGSVAGLWLLDLDRRTSLLIGDFSDIRFARLCASSLSLSDRQGWERALNYAQQNQPLPSAAEVQPTHSPSELKGNLAAMIVSDPQQFETFLMQLEERGVNVEDAFQDSGIDLNQVTDGVQYNIEQENT